MAAYEILGQRVSLIAGTDLTDKMYHFVKVDSTCKAVLPAATTDAIVGVSYQPAKEGEADTIIVSGVARVVAGAAIVAGDPVAGDATGAAVKATGSVGYGIALTAGAKGEQVAVLLKTVGVVTA